MVFGGVMAGRAFLRWLATLALLCAAPPAAAAQADTANEIAAAAARLDVDPQVVENLVVANRILAYEGITDAYGHVSVRNPRHRDRYLIARSVAPELVTAADIIEYDLDSNPVQANAPAGFIERYIHGEIYKARPDVMSIVHTHSPGVIP